jgi:hypothetical protein
MLEGGALSIMLKPFEREQLLVAVQDALQPSSDPEVTAVVQALPM